MTDDLFLKLCYFGMGGFSLVLGFGVFLVLRRSFTGTLTAVLPGFRSAGRVLLLLILVSSFSGFLSVSMPGCQDRRYREIVSDETYIIGKMKEQASTAMFYLAESLVASGFVVAVLLSFTRVARSRRLAPAETDESTAAPRG